jgi:Zn-dependent metalloprotease
MKSLLPILLVALCFEVSYAQHGKPTPTFKNEQTSPSPSIHWPGKDNLPPTENPLNFQQSEKKPLPVLAPKSGTTHASIKMTLGENGLPILMEGKTAASENNGENRTIPERALEYLSSLQPPGLASPSQEFVVKSVQTDEQGNDHIRMDQWFQGVPVWGGELIAHTNNGIFVRVNGRYFPTPKLTTVTPRMEETPAITVVKTKIGTDKIKTNWTAAELKLIDGQPFSADLLVFHRNNATDGECLAWRVIAHPNVLSRLVYFVDAATGEILDSYDNTCNFVGHHHNGAEICTPAIEHNVASGLQVSSVLNGPVTIQGQDLLNINRTFTNGGWQIGTQVVLEDASKSMFNAGTSNMPSDPVGAIVTIDGLSTSPENGNFDYDLISSNATVFTNVKAGISAHYNAGLSFDYFKTKFNRNSIDGVGGNIISFVNITEGDGTSMENAFWNGAAMWYGNGGNIFKPLARGLDVGGHEMTHGVVEKTANLVYQGESGALNESFADVFGAMIDNDDWKIGEDVVISGVTPSGCLRDLSNPHNGASSGTTWWQPSHTNEQFTGATDNGGVHINSGIPNHAFYLFANNASVGKTKAEQVYYKALRDYLTKSSKFVDCRIAVIQAATDLYGTSVANIAASAFTAVGIGGSTPSGNYLGQLNPNPGTDYVLCVSNDLQNLDLATGAGTILGTVYNQGVQSRPSIIDNGLDLVFVNEANNIIGISFDYSTNPITYSTFTLSTTAEWRQAVISKNGRFVAALTTTKEPVIHIFDLITDESRAYNLYNPTYSTGQITGDVQYADVLEFDYSGENLMYDSYNEIGNNQGESIGYWDIGFLQFRKNGQFTPVNNAFISKLFSGLPENTSIGNPAFAKNSPFVIAFDFIDENGTTPSYDVYGANSETGDYNVLVSNNGTLGWPSYNRLDSKLMYETNPSQGTYNLRLQGLASSKIQPTGNSTAFISNHSWGAWYGNGSRNLALDSKEPLPSPLNIQVTPNPVQAETQITLNATRTADAEITVYNIYGQTWLTRSVKLQEGDNILDMDMRTLPAGTYIVRVVSGILGAAVKITKL